MKQDQENQAFSVWFGTDSCQNCRMGRIGLGIHIGGVRYRTLGRRRSLFSLFGHLAIGHKYRNHGYHVSRLVFLI